MREDYAKARRLGKLAYRRAVLRGQYPYLPALSDMVEEIDRYPEIPLGTAEVPIDRIVGTRNSGRQNAFAANFMPLLEEKTEFAAKWSSLYDSQIEEGIREPVKVYEFLNRYYVEEGNKRVSVLRFIGAVTIPAVIIRIRPPYRDEEPIRLYYEYLDFYKVTRSLEIVFSAPGRYGQLARVLEQNLQDPWPEDLLEKLHTGFIAFKTIYQKKGGERTGLPAADALLVYLGVYSLDSLLQESNEEISRRIQRLWPEFSAAAGTDDIALIEDRGDVESHARSSPLSRAVKMLEETVGKTEDATVSGAAEIAGVVAGITAGVIAGDVEGTAQETKRAVREGLEAVIPMHPEPAGAQPVYSPSNPLRIAFIHEKDAERSGWVYGHELGRNHLKEAFGSLTQTMRFENCVDEDSIQEAFQTAEEENCGIIFTTAVSLIQPSLRFAVDHPHVKVLNCSFNQTIPALRFYHGKMYEAKFLMGALAAGLAEGHRIGYVAGKKEQSAFSSVNAFALGAQLIDPYCRVSLRWTGDSSSPFEDGSAGKGIHVFSDIDMVRLTDENRRYGLYYRDEEGGFRRLAAPIWNWGVFYEMIVRRVLDGTYDNVPAQQKDRAVNYWLGISSGIIDILLSDHVPAPSRRLVTLLRRGIEEGRVHPFEGELRARDGTVHGSKDTALTTTEIMSMDWLVENVDGEPEREIKP